MLPSLATIEELELRLGPVEPDLGQATLDDASALVRAEAGKTWVDEGGELEPVPDPIRTVVLGASIRRLNNPSGYASEQIGQYSYRFSGDSVGGVVFLTEEERRIIRKVVRKTLVYSIPIQIDGLGKTTDLVEETEDIWKLVVSESQ